MKKSNNLLCRLVSAGLAFSLSPAQAWGAGFGCAGVAGEVLFKDTLYGAGTGLVIAGIAEVVRDDHENLGKRIGTGAAIGAGMGLTLGVLEILIRDCRSPSRVNQVSTPGFQRPNVVMNFSSPGHTGYGLGFTYNLGS